MLFLTPHIPIVYSSLADFNCVLHLFCRHMCRGSTSQLSPQSVTALVISTSQASSQYLPSLHKYLSDTYVLYTLHTYVWDMWGTDRWNGLFWEWQSIVLPHPVVGCTYRVCHVRRASRGVRNGGAPRRRRSMLQMDGRRQRKI